MMLQKQKWSQVVSKVISGKKAMAFDAAMFSASKSEEADSAVGNAELGIILKDGDFDSNMESPLSLPVEERDFTTRK